MAPATEMKKKIDVDGGKAGGKGGKDKGNNELTVFIGGLSFSLDEATVRKDFTECGEIETLRMPLNEEGKPKGFAFVTYKDQASIDKALKFDGEQYAGRYLQVNMAGQKDDKGKGKGKDKAKDGKSKHQQNSELTAFVRGLPFTTEEEALRKDFAECGTIVHLKVPKNEEGGSKGIAFIEFENTEGFEAAMKFDGTEYGGRTINVQKAGEGGGKGKDGKGKGKDGKDKGKKGKKPSSEGFAKSTGAMVESTGDKKTFDDDSDDS